MRVWRDREVRDSRFWNPEMKREVRVVGRRIESGSFEKEVASGNMPPMERSLREVSLERPHWDRGVLIFSQLWMESSVRRVRFFIRGSNNSRFLKSSILRSVRVLRQSGRALRLGYPRMRKD